MTGPEHVPIDVLLVEDHPTFRLGLRTRLALEPALEVVGEAATAAEGLALAVDLAPDVVVADLHLPDRNGVELIGDLHEAVPRSQVLVLTMHDDDSVFAAVRAGARGYLLKGTEPDQIVAAIRSVSAGDAVFSAGVAARLLALHGAAVPARASAFPDLSPREVEILELVARGLANAAIGRRLGLRPKTVRNYVSNVISKLQAADRADAILRAQRAGLGGQAPDRQRRAGPVPYPQPGR